MHLPTSIPRLKASDVPLAPMGDAQLRQLGELEAFAGLDPEFRQSPAFRRILQKDSRLVDYQHGEIIIREGDWGNSAFFLVSGQVKVEIEPRGRFPQEFLGRRIIRRKGWLAALAQLWKNHRGAEYRDVQSYREDHGTGRRGSGENTRIYLQDVDAVLENYKTTDVGALFGELAALGRTARTATVFAVGDVRLLEMRWQGLRDLMRKDTGFRRDIDARFRANALRAFLLNSPIFAHLKDDEAAMQELVDGAELSTYGEFDKVGTLRELAEEGARRGLAGEPIIAAEGDHPNGIVMVRSGLARLSRKHHHGHLTVGYLCPGQVYGFEEIAAGYHQGSAQPLKYSLRGIGFISVICIPTTLVEKHLLEGRPRPSIAPTRRAAPGAPKLEAERISPGFVEFLVQERFVNGTETMLIDLDRCTRCDDCVRACATAHDNNPRFVRQGPINNRVMVANACMHCQDPVCMIECPTGAISRDLSEGLVVINDLTCIGCATCANNCPYDAIRMAEIRGDDGAFIRDTQTQLPIAKATKCDLCVDQLGGPACQRACPHDALVRMDMRDMDRLADWQNR